MQEAARLEHQMHLFADASDACDVQRLHRAGRLTGGVAEGGEVVLADQGLGGGVHGLYVQRFFDMPDPAPVQRRTTGAVQDAVQVFAPGRREARMPVVADRRAVQHRHRLLHQMGVQGVHHRLRGPVALQIDMAGLARGVDARVGATSGGDARLLTAKGRDRRLDRALHGRLIGLGLKAVVGRAVVFDGEAIAGHQPRTAPAAMGKPRSISSADCAALPGRCTRVRRTAPVPQAMVRASSST